MKLKELTPEQYEIWTELASRISTKCTRAVGEAAQDLVDERKITHEELTKATSMDTLLSGMYVAMMEVVAITCKCPPSQAHMHIMDFMQHVIGKVEKTDIAEHDALFERTKITATRH